MTTLTILGTHAGDVWIETDGELTCLTVFDLRIMRNTVRTEPTVTRVGLTFDESDVTALLQALAGPQLDDCADCEGPALANVEGRMVCPGHAAGFGLREARA